MDERALTLLQPGDGEEDPVADRETGLGGGRRARLPRMPNFTCNPSLKGGHLCCAATVLLSAVAISSVGAGCGPVVFLKRDEQLLLEYPSDKSVKNGPGPVVFWPFIAKTTKRPGLLLGELEYANVIDTISGIHRAEAGPQLLFLDAYETAGETQHKYILEKDEYIRLLNKKTGELRVVPGPAGVVPEPTEETQGVEQGVSLQKHEFVRLTDSATGAVRVERGEKLVFPAPTERLEGKQSAFQLKKGQYIKLTDKSTGNVRVEIGEKIVFPDPMEETSGVSPQDAVQVDEVTAALVVSRETGQQSLITEKGPYVPGPYDDILEVRELIRVEPHEVAITKDDKGVFHFYNDHDPLTEVINTTKTAMGTAFFLPPHYELITMFWGSGTSAEDLANNIVNNAKTVAYKVPVTKIDTRAQYAFFEYKVRTSDKVELLLEGTIFWQVVNVPTMISKTGDPKGDVWYHTRSVLSQAVSRVTFEDFMTNFNQIVQEASNAQDDDFYKQRGCMVHNVEVTRYQCVNDRTEEVLQEIIQETTNRVNRKQHQESENEVAQEKMKGDIDIEKKRAELIQAQADNERKRAVMEGSAQGLKLGNNALSFIELLANSSVADEAKLELFKFFEEQKTAITRMQSLASGNATLFLTPDDMQLRLQMPAPGTGQAAGAV